VYPPRFRYEAPRSLDEAVALLAAGGGEAKVLAGGQSLVPLLKLRFAAPELLVDINGLPGLDHHRLDADGTLRVGALCRHADLERSTVLGPTMAAAAPLVADPIVRNRGTLVGSLCHADPQGDWASVVTALGGHVVALGPHGRRTIPVTDFVSGPFQNTLSYDELATAGVAVAVELSGGVVTRAGIALTGVGGSTIDATEAARVLVGSPLTAEAVAEAAELAARAARPRTDHRGSAAFKRQVVRTFVRRILSRVTEPTGKTELTGEGLT
jgi:carbon-monoxide dehydrogenase medium subunit